MANKIFLVLFLQAEQLHLSASAANAFFPPPSPFLP